MLCCCCRLLIGEVLRVLLKQNGFSFYCLLINQSRSLSECFWRWSTIRPEASTVIAGEAAGLLPAHGWYRRSHMENIACERRPRRHPKGKEAVFFHVHKEYPQMTFRGKYRCRQSVSSICSSFDRRAGQNKGLHAITTIVSIATLSIAANRVRSSL